MHLEMTFNIYKFIWKRRKGFNCKGKVDEESVVGVVCWRKLMLLSRPTYVNKRVLNIGLKWRAGL